MDFNIYGNLGINRCAATKNSKTSFSDKLLRLRYVHIYIFVNISYLDFILNGTTRKMKIMHFTHKLHVKKSKKGFYFLPCIELICNSYNFRVIDPASRRYDKNNVFIKGK